jgi:pyruvate/2-oxoglutarate dehydrogenase complex dihydrolipoamide acyltransferase (E2) component
MSCCACRQWPSGGLAAQAIHDADQLPLDQLMARMRDLVQRARAGRIRSSEIADPTITVSSLRELERRQRELRSAQITERRVDQGNVHESHFRIR